MRIVSPTGESVELRILGYQYPETATADYDSNWLRVEGNVVHPQGAWTFEDPCLLTYEALALAEWFSAIADGKVVSPDMDFTEPNLAFQLIETGGKRTMRISFWQEARPPWAGQNFDQVDPDMFVEVPAESEQLLRAAKYIRDALKEFPQRARR